MKIRNSLLIYNIALAAILFCPLLIFSQAEIPDTIIFKGNERSYLDFTCEERKKLIQIILEDDTDALKKAVNTVTANYHFGHIQSVNNLISNGEKHLSFFVIGKFDLILDDLRNGKDFFNFDVQEFNIHQPNFNCGLVGQDLLSKWQSASERVIYDIQYAALRPSEKELLIFYWKAILLTIEDKPSELMTLVNESQGLLVRSYEECGCKVFLNRMSSIKVSFFPNHTDFLDFSIGRYFLGGQINEYLNSGFYFSLEAGRKWNRWSLSARMNIGDLGNGSKQLQAIEQIDITSSDRVSLFLFSLRPSFLAINSDKFLLNTIFGLNASSLNNIQNESDTIETPEFNRFRLNIDAGLSMSILLGKDVIMHPTLVYGNKNFSNYYLQINMGYIHNLFYQPTLVSGNLFHLSVGLRIEWGIRGLNFRHPMQFL
jgi:hypothetical protein